MSIKNFKSQPLNRLLHCSSVYFKSFLSIIIQYYKLSRRHSKTERLTAKRTLQNNVVGEMAGKFYPTTTHLNSIYIYHYIPTYKLPFKNTFKLNSIHTLSATPPGRMVFTITPVLLPPTIPKPSPEPSLCNSTVSMWRRFSPSPAYNNAKISFVNVTV